ncbi:hypothetical protein ACOTTU_10310 [Roseobacter sp. EG26]
MKTNAKFVQSIIKTAAEAEVTLPWTRGPRRAAFVAKRNEAEKERRQIG